MRGLESGCDGDGWRRECSPGVSIRIPVARVGEGSHPLSAHSCTPGHAFAVPSARMAFIRYLTCCVTASPPVAGARQARGVRRGKGGCE